MLNVDIVRNLPVLWSECLRHPPHVEICRIIKPDVIILGGGAFGGT